VIFVAEGLDSPPSPLPILVLIHGDSYEWGSSATLDGSALAAHANVAVVTLNYRLGILGNTRQIFNLNLKLILVSHEKFQRISYIY